MEKLEKQCWQHEFSGKYQPPAEIVQLIETHPNVSDDSWHNDICPHLSYYAKMEDRGMRAPKVEFLWDAILAEDRELSDQPRFMVVLFPQSGEEGNEGHEEKTVMTDDLSLALRTFHEFVEVSRG